MGRIILLLLLPFMVTAEQEYFTWVDAQGRIHNSVVSDKAITDQPEDADARIVNKNDYLTEEQFEQSLKKETAENPPFFTYVDETGRVRNQVIVDTQIEVEAVDAPVSYDHIYAPPFRVSEAMAKGCCDRYRSYFKAVIPAEKSVLLSGFLNTVPMSTRFGAKKAWYFRLDDPSEFRVMQLKLRQTEQDQVLPVSMILADRQFSTLYFTPELSLRLQQGSWSGQPFSDAVVKIDDQAVAAVIIYFPAGAPDNASLEVNWWHGKASD